VARLPLMWIRSFVAVALGSLVLGHSSARYDTQTHQSKSSLGCGKPSPYVPGKTSVAKGKYAGSTWTFRVYVPRNYDDTKPMPLVIQHPGWGVDARREERGCGITLYADKVGFISVTAQGADDNTHNGGPWYSWNAAGTSLSPGRTGATCTSAANAESYCYSSCSCSDHPQCDWTTCRETGPTPSGTGRSDIGGFIPSLYNTLESQLCIDTTREYAAGESNGGIMTYQLGVDLSHRLAAIAPQFGSFMRGFNMAPDNGVPVIDIHGFHDTTVPANVSLSSEGYYYTPTAEIFGGNKYSLGWKVSNNCSGPDSHYKTRYDGVKELYCVSEGSCKGGDVVRCGWNGGHNWFANDASDNGGLVTDFLKQWTKPSHIGMGRVEGEEVHLGSLLEDVSVATTEDIEEGQAELDVETAIVEQEGREVEHGPFKRHYGDPTEGCLPDEDDIRLGTGVTCAPKIDVEPESAEVPAPKCHIGGLTRSANGCPESRTSAFPVCLAKGDNTTNPYAEGIFHCVLLCPCEKVKAGEVDCGISGHLHCPLGAKCERGELQHRLKGVCTYHGHSLGAALRTSFV